MADALSRLPLVVSVISGPCDFAQGDIGGSFVRDCLTVCSHDRCVVTPQTPSFCAKSQNPDTGLTTVVESGDGGCL